MYKKPSPKNHTPKIIERLYPSNYLNALAADGSGRTNREVKTAHLHSHRLHRRTQPITGRLGQLSAAALHRCKPPELNLLAESVAPAKLVVLTGAQDTVLCPEESLILLSHLPGSELQVIQDGGHALGSQIPSRYNELIERIMRIGSEAVTALWFPWPVI